ADFRFQRTRCRRVTRNVSMSRLGPAVRMGAAAESVTGRRFRLSSLLDIRARAPMTVSQRAFGCAGHFVSAIAAAVVAGAAVAAEDAADALCERWADPVVAGELDIGLMPEASGIAVSARGDRLYHVN